MMLATPAPRMRARSPSEDEETLIYSRPARVPVPSPSSALFEDLVRQLAAPLTPPRILHVQSALPLIPIVFEDTPEPPPPAPAPPLAPRPRSRLRIPALVFVMSLGVGFGVAHDEHARASVTTHARSAAHAAYTWVLGWA